MRQLILPEDYNKEEVYTLPEEDSHYLLRVQRKSIGFELQLLDKEGVQYNGKIIGITNNLCQVSLNKSDTTSKSAYKISLLQCIPKGKKIDLMIRQSVEVGVDSFYPITAEHSVPVFKTEADREKKHSSSIKAGQAHGGDETQS